MQTDFSTDRCQPWSVHSPALWHTLNSYGSAVDALAEVGRNTGRPRQSHGVIVTIITSAGPLISLVAGILILIMPRLLNYIVAIYLIIIGLLGLFGGHHLH